MTMFCRYIHIMLLLSLCLQIVASKSNDLIQFSIIINTYYQNIYAYSGSCSTQVVENRITNGVCSSISSYDGDIFYTIISCDEESNTSKYNIDVYLDINCQRNKIYSSQNNAQSTCLLISYAYDLESSIDCNPAKKIISNSILRLVIIFICVFVFCLICYFNYRKRYALAQQYYLYSANSHVLLSYSQCQPQRLIECDGQIAIPILTNNNYNNIYRNTIDIRSNNINQPEICYNILHASAPSIELQELSDNNNQDYSNNNNNNNDQEEIPIVIAIPMFAFSCNDG